MVVGKVAADDPIQDELVELTKLGDALQVCAVSFGEIEVRIDRIADEFRLRYALGSCALPYLLPSFRRKTDRSFR